ncbi:MAG: glycosyltransferase [Chitinophagales bacterium]|nr:glycosyltransferase [Bacteroidota bacterium]MCB9042536.1 glycosyltransferase [Chitinophagales bacterium]
MYDLASTDIIILSMSRWDGIYSSAILSMAKAMAAHQRVFYIDHPFTAKDYIKGYRNEEVLSRKNMLLGKSKPFRQVFDDLPNFVAVTPPIMLPVNFLSNNFLYKKGASINDKRLFGCIQKIIDEYRINEYIFINSFNPFYVQKWSEAVEKPLLYVYQSRDDISQESYIARHGIRLEQAQIRQADVALATSRQLCQKLSASSGKKVAYLPSGVAVNIFTKPMPIPKELESIPQARIIYTGNISNLRMDYKLLQYLSQNLRDFSFVFIGEKSVVPAEILQLPNFHFLGTKHISELGAYLQHCQVGIIPFACNTLTKSIYPLKINEYLACKLPVVSTPFSEDLQDFGEHISLAHSYEDFAAAIKKYYLLNSPNILGKEIAVQNSWENRRLQFFDILKSYQTLPANVA